MQTIINNVLTALGAVVFLAICAVNLLGKGSERVMVRRTPPRVDQRDH